VNTKSIFSTFVFALLLGSCATAPRAVGPGPMADGRTMLPNGWMLSPAGDQLEVGDLPLNMALSPDGRFAAALNSGQGEQSVSLISLSEWRVVQSAPIAKGWLGISFSHNGKRLYVSGGNDNQILVFDVTASGLRRVDSLEVAPPWPKGQLWLAGLDVDDERGHVYVVGRESEMLYRVDLATGSPDRTLKLPAQPYTCLLSRELNRIYVSLWGGSGVAIIDKSTLSLENVVAVGDHPNDMVESPDGRFLFVANANANTVSVIDVQKARVVETLSSSLVPDAPPGSTPNSVALSTDGSRLYIANADNNTLAVMDVSEPGASRSLGFIPVGWYPTCVRVMSGTDHILVLNGKGGSSRANPHGPNPEKRGRYDEFIGSLFRGTLARINRPGAGDLERYSRQAYANSPFTRQKLDHPHADTMSPIPVKTGLPSPIKYVFYIIKENRTYDQVLGDVREGNGDSSLCLFPDAVTPNQHALARTFVLFDNFYVDAEVSADGHNWSMGAYATDYVEKSWPTLYGGRGGIYDFEGGDSIAYPAKGYLWDNCLRNGVTVRSYGEFVLNGRTPKDSVKPSIASLEGHVAPFYQGYDLEYSDLDRYLAWKAEFDAYDSSGGLPQLQIIRLPNNHTQGTRKGKLTPKAYVAQNDLALGLIIERISKSRYWPEAAVFVLEDDAQNGPDHVDAHRSVAFVASPYAKRNFVDHGFYSTSGMLRTMELILGLPPMSQYDAAASPFVDAFAISPNGAPYVHREAMIDLKEVNVAGAYGQDRSGQLTLSREDSAPDIEFNEIIWKSVKGPDSPMPAPVRSAFVRIAEPASEEN
jgi:YVTN family beta-propeller protein